LSVCYWLNSRGSLGGGLVSNSNFVSVALASLMEVVDSRRVFSILASVLETLLGLRLGTDRS
jgi:hypothetical protein